MAVDSGGGGDEVDVLVESSRSKDHLTAGVGEQVGVVEGWVAVEALGVDGEPSAFWAEPEHVLVVDVAGRTRGSCWWSSRSSAIAAARVK